MKKTKKEIKSALLATRVTPAIKTAFIEKAVQERRDPSDKLRVLVEDYTNAK